MKPESSRKGEDDTKIAEHETSRIPPPSPLRWMEELDCYKFSEITSGVWNVDCFVGDLCD